MDKHMLMEKTVDRESQQKLYVQIYPILREKIEKGDWPPGARIPSEDELCKTFDVSKATVRIAVSELDRQGYLRRRQGKGTFIHRSLPNFGMDIRTRLTENMFGEGVKTRKEILVKGIKEPPDDVRSYLEWGDEIYYVLCKRVVEDRPAYLEESFLPLHLFPGIENEDMCQKSFFHLVQEKADRRISKVIQTIEVTELDGDAADILRVARRSSALLLHRLLIGSNGSPIAYTRLLGSGRTYKIQTEFERIR
jgi:GntR family transcriptional regulator